MSTLTNLLPSDRARVAESGYLLRLAALVFTLAAALIGIHAALLLPSYIYLAEEEKTRAAHLEDIASSLESSEEETQQARLVALSGDADALLALTKGPSASAAMRSILSVPRGGVRIYTLALTLPESGGAQMRLTGIAPTRESLRAFHGALKAVPGIASADLPLSVYAAERDLPFSITLMGTPTP